MVGLSDHEYCKRLGRERSDLLFAHLGRIIHQKINDDVACAGLEKDRHVAICRVPIPAETKVCKHEVK